MTKGQNRALKRRAIRRVLKRSDTGDCSGRFLARARYGQGVGRKDFVPFDLDKD